ncbi:MAG: hypothetical protein ABSD82_11470 [Solirubrobacteraceae bacterium]|jgi:hypothetical protein
MTRCEFTLEEYRNYLALAIDCGYRFVDFESLDHAGDRSGLEILLRHDIDYAPVLMAPMAAIEARLGVHATYCLHVDSPWYSIDTPENRAAIEKTLGAGHSLGLHFDATTIASDEQVCERALEQAKRLGEAFAREVRVVSFHMPGRRPVDHLVLPAGLINTYASRFFVEIGYVSDSNQNWRGVDLETVLRSREQSRLQLLIHPFWWRAEPGTMRSKLFDFAAQIGVDVNEMITHEQWALMDEQEAAA